MMLTALALKVYRDRAAALYEQYKGARDQWAKTVDPTMLKAINIQRRLKGKYYVRGSKAVTSSARPSPFTLCVAVIDLDHMRLTVCPCPCTVSFGRRRTR